MADIMTIWNMALGWLGARTIASQDENTQEAVQCRLFWDSARRQTLRDYPWNFAQRRAWLAEIPVPEGWELQYRHAYALPQDCVKAARVLEEGRRETRFVLGYDPAQGRGVLLSSAVSALLCYTADMPDISLGDDNFAHVLARRLAALAAVPLLKNNQSKVQELEQLYRAAIPNAVEADAGEGREEEKPDAWIAARGGYQ